MSGILVGAGVILVNYPEGVPFPNTKQKSGGKSKGIANLLTSEQERLSKALAHPTHPLHFVAGKNKTGMFTHQSADWKDISLAYIQPSKSPKSLYSLGFHRLPRPSLKEAAECLLMRLRIARDCLALGAPRRRLHEPWSSKNVNLHQYSG
jgi:hypothetical protein